MTLTGALLIATTLLSAVQSNCIFQLKSRTKIATVPAPPDTTTFPEVATEKSVIEDCSDTDDCKGYLRTSIKNTGTQTVEYKYYKVTTGDISTYVNEDIPADEDHTSYYVKTTSCTDAGSYTVDAATGDSCPTTGEHLSVPCSRVSDTTNEALCNAESAYCCWDGAKCHVAATALCEAKTRLSYDYSGHLKSFEVNSVRTDKKQIFLGEYIELECSGDLLFTNKNGFNVDSTSKTKLYCNVNSDGKFTDLVKTYENIKCEAPCRYADLQIDENTQKVDFDTSTPLRAGTEYTLSCQDGYGLSSGKTDVTVACSTSALGETYKCSQCTTPTAVHQTFSANTAIPSAEITSTCSNGYSYNQQLTEKQECKIDTPKLTFGECVEDCTVTKQDSSTEALFFEATYTGSCPTGKDYNVADKTSNNHVYTCSTGGGTYAEPQCHDICKLSGTNIFDGDVQVEKDGSTIKSDSTGEEVNPGAAIKIKCPVGKTLAAGETDELTCAEGNYNSGNTGTEWSNIPKCYDKCSVDPTSQSSVTVFSDDTEKTATFKINYGQNIKVTCKSSDQTFFGEDVSSKEVKCEGSTISLVGCVDPCKRSMINGIDTITSNTIITPSTFQTNNILGLNVELEMECPDGYQFPGTQSKNKVTFGRCSRDNSQNLVYEVEQTIDADYKCLAVPIIESITPNGDQSMLVKYGLPSDYDKTNGQPSKFEGKKYDDDAAAVLTTDMTCLPNCEFSLTGLTKEAPVQMTIIATYNPTVESVKYKDVYPLRKATITAVSAVGVGVVKFSIADGITDDTFRQNANKDVTYKVEIKEGTTVKSSSSISAGDVTNTAKEMTANIVGAKSLTQYNLVIKTMDVADNFGGETIESFTTGYGKATLTHNLISSTSNQLTITLPDGIDTTGKINVDIEFSSQTKKEELDFANGKATYLLEGLVAKTQYVVKVKIYSNGVAGDEAELTFSQGPSEVENISETFPAIDSVTLTWDAITGAKYLVTLADKDGTPLEGDQYEKEVTEATVTFTGLSRGTMYKASITTEQEVDGKLLKSDKKEFSFTTFACALTDKDGFKLLIKSAGSDVAGKIVTEPYFKADENTQYWVQCAEDDHVLDVAEGLSVDNITSCDGPNAWSYHDTCVKGGASTDSGSSDGMVVGVVVAVVFIIILVIIIIIFIRRKRRDNSGGKSNKKYSPRAAEEKQNIDPGAADIPANGDNVSNRSVEAKVTFNEDEDNVIVNPNNPVETV